MIKEVTNIAAAAMVKKFEDEIKAALDHFIPGWTLEDVKTRCVLQRVRGEPDETLVIDGRPVLKFGPVESELTPKGELYVARYTRKVWRIA